MPNPAFMAQLPPTTRLGAPAFSREAGEAYERALLALKEEGVEFLVGGALAFNAYTGIWRDTKDLDLFCRPADSHKVLKALARAGFATEVVYESWLGKAYRGDVFVDLIWRNANALFPVEESWFERAGTIEMFGSRHRIIPLEELLVSKMMVCGRYRFDGADIMHIFHACGETIDWKRLEELCGEHSELMLAHMHMFRWGYPGSRERVPDDVVERFTRLSREATSTFGPFRARLLDIQSFQVDVDGWELPDPHKQALTAIFGDPEGRQ